MSGCPGTCSTWGTEGRGEDDTKMHTKVQVNHSHPSYVVHVAP